MKGFFFGLLVSVAAYWGYSYYKGLNRHPGPPVHGGAEGGVPDREADDRKKHRRRGAMRVARSEGAAPGTSGGALRTPPPPPVDTEPEPTKLSPADLKLVSQGD